MFRPYSRHRRFLPTLGLLLALVLALAACGGGGSGGPPTITIDTPTMLGSYATRSNSLRLSGSVAGASTVRVSNSTTGASTLGAINYFNLYGTDDRWYADVTGLVLGNNVLVVTADAGGSGMNTATAILIVTVTP